MSYKQVIVVRDDLNMSLGKTAAQAAHASLESYKATKSKKPSWVKGWESEGSKKIVLRVASLAELVDLEKRCKGLPHALITDAGFTELQPGTITCLGIGPASEESVNKITGNLKSL